MKEFIASQIPDLRDQCNCLQSCAWLGSRSKASRQPPESKSKKKQLKPHICGSLTHQKTTHRECPKRWPRSEVLVCCSCLSFSCPSSNVSRYTHLQSLYGGRTISLDIF